MPTPIQGIAAVSPPGDCLATRSVKESDIALWHLDAQGAPRTLSGHHGAITALAHHPREPWLASAAADRTIRLWQRSTGEWLHTLPDLDATCTALAFTSDGNQLVAGDEAGSLRFWDLASKKLLRTTSTSASVTALACGANGIAAVATASELALWDARSNKRLRTCSEPGLPVRALSFSPDGKRLAGVAETGQLLLWDVDTAVLILQRAQPTPLAGLSFDSTGAFLYLAAQSGLLRCTGSRDD